MSGPLIVLGLVLIFAATYLLNAPDGRTASDPRGQPHSSADLPDAARRPGGDGRRVTAHRREAARPDQDPRRVRP